MRTRIIRALMLAFSIIGLTATAAFASDYLSPTQHGGVVVNSVYSLTDIKVSNQANIYNSTTVRNIPVGGTSQSYANFQDVDAFYVYPGCYAENVKTGYRYSPGISYGKWYIMSSDSVYIALKLVCY